MTHKLRVAAIGAALTFAAVPALAADLLTAPPPRIIPAPIEVGGGWYLRGDVGVGVQEFDSVRFRAGSLAGFPTGAESIGRDVFDNPTLIGLGVGYAFNEWFRMDVTGEYRSDSRFRFIVDNPPFAQVAPFEGNVRTMLGLVNAYADIGNFWGITPFVGVGIGFAHHDMRGFAQLPGVNSSLALGSNGDRTEFTWALHAGLAYTVSENLKLELSYRYVDMGNLPHTTVRCTGQPGCYGVDVRDVTSHDFRVGMRWMLNPPAPVLVPRPVIARN